MSARFRSVSYLHTRGPGLAGHLSALQHATMTDLATVRHLLEHCVPPHYRLTGAYLRASHRCLQAHLAQVRDVTLHYHTSHTDVEYALSQLYFEYLLFDLTKLSLWPRSAAGTWRVVKSLLCSTGCCTSTTGEVNRVFIFMSVDGFCCCRCQLWLPEF